MDLRDKSEAVQKLSDPLWRLRNLYRIVDKRGREIPFVPNIYQERLLHAYYVQRKRRHVILKARRMGFSTLIDIILFDAAYWNNNLQASIVDLTQSDASEKLRTKVKFAWEHLPRAIREQWEKCNESAMEFANGSTINAGKNARGGTNQLLHISEWGPIAHEDPRRSEEIKTGALPSADLGDVFVESTFKGGKGGHFYELVKAAMETPTELKTEKDFWFHFFPWYEDPSNTLEGDARAVSKEVHRYLDEKELELGVQFTPGQRLWYQVTKREQGIFMLREYPTTVDEAFQAPVEGAVYGDIISKLRAAGQVRDFIWDQSYPVFSCWDIGWDDSTSIWLFQVVGREIHWIWQTRQRHHTAAEMVKMISDTGIPVTNHFLPWDSKSTASATGLSYKGEVEKAGLVNVVAMEPTRDEWATINATRDILKRSYIHATNCATGLDSLDAYHTKDTSSGGTVSKLPVHDWSSHDCKAMQYGVEAIVLGKVSTRHARRIAADPLLPGETIDLETHRERLAARRPMSAASGISL